MLLIYILICGPGRVSIFQILTSVLCNQTVITVKISAQIY